MGNERAKGVGGGEGMGREEEKEGYLQALQIFQSEDWGSEGEHKQYITL